MVVLSLAEHLRADPSPPDHLSEPHCDQSTRLTALDLLTSVQDAEARTALYAPELGIR